MPFYEYKCAECGEVFTLLQKREAKRSGYACPKCESTQTERVFSTFAAATSSGSSPSSDGGGHCCGGSCACRH